MDLYLSLDEDYSSQGGRVSLSSFDAGTVDDYLDFMRRRPRGHGLALDIPDRDNYRGRIHILSVTPHILTSSIFRTFVPLSQSRRQRYRGTATNEHSPLPT